MHIAWILSRILFRTFEHIVLIYVTDEHEKEVSMTDSEKDWLNSMIMINLN